MEKSDFSPRLPREVELFHKEIAKDQSKIARMLDADPPEAYIADKRDQEGNVISISIYKNDGTLLYYRDDEGIRRYYEKNYKKGV